MTTDRPWPKNKAKTAHASAKKGNLGNFVEQAVPYTQLEKKSQSFEVSDAEVIRHAVPIVDQGGIPHPPILRILLSQGLQRVKRPIPSLLELLKQPAQFPALLNSSVSAHYP